MYSKTSIYCCCQDQGCDGWLKRRTTEMSHQTSRYSYKTSIMVCDENVNKWIIDIFNKKHNLQYITVIVPSVMLSILLVLKNTHNILFMMADDREWHLKVILLYTTIFKDDDWNELLLFKIYSRLIQKYCDINVARLGTASRYQLINCKRTYFIWLVLLWWYFAVLYFYVTYKLLVKRKIEVKKQNVWEKQLTLFVKQLPSKKLTDILTQQFASTV